MNIHTINIIQENVDTKEYEDIEDWFENEMKIGNKDLTIVHVNVRSLNLTKWSLLQMYLKNFKNIDIVVLTELSVKEEHIYLYQIKNYNVFSYHRDRKKGGGIAVYVKDNIQASKLTNATFKFAENIEIELDKKNIIINAIYRPPNMNVKEFIKEVKKWSTCKAIKNKDIIMIGDININTLEDSSNKQDYIEMLSNNGMLNVIQKITREEILNGRVVKSCLDHINIRTKLKYSSGVIKEKIADHYFTYLKLNQNSNDDGNKLIEIHIIDEEKIKKLIEEFDWNNLLKENKDANTLYGGIVNTFKGLYAAAKKVIQIKKKYEGNTWITKEIREDIKTKKFLWKRAKKYPENTFILKKYQDFRNKLNNKITQAKRKENTSKFYNARGDMKTTWKVIDIITNKKKKNVEKTIINNFKKSGLSIQKIAENFNINFKNEIINLKNGKENLNTTIDINHENLSNSEQFEIKEMSIPDLWSIMKEINQNKGPGNDGIRPKDLKTNMLFLQDILKELMNKIIAEGTIPEGMKISNISPIYKKEKKDSYSNYRPIAILSVLEKILEKHINNQLNRYMDKNSVINDNQYGFRKGRDTIQALQVYSEDIKNALNNNKYCLTLTLDLKKAYDTIDHVKMIENLEQNMRLSEKTRTLFKNYFEQRKQIVKIGNTKSNAIDITCGLITGAILSPSLFNIYVNDINKIEIKSKILQYADDTLLYYVHENLDELYNTLQEDLNKLIIWLHKKDIFLNKEKTKAILFQNPMVKRFRRNETKYLKIHENKCIDSKSFIDCQCKIMINEKSMKYLGVYFDQDLKWNSQINYVKNKLNIIAYKMHHMKKIMPVRIKCMLYKTLCDPVLRYGLEMYGCTTVKNKNQIKSVQKKIIKSTMYPNTAKNERNRIVNEQRIMNFENLHSYIILTRNYFKEKYRERCENQYNTRQIKFTIPKIMNLYGASTIRFQMTNLLNKIPRNLLEITSEKEMKKEMINYLLKGNNEI